VIPVVAGIGNALLAVPMIRELKRQIPQARITVLARIDAMGEPFRRLAEVDEVLVTGKGVKGIWRNIAWSRGRGPDVYLVPFPSNRWQYALLALFSGAKRRVLHSYPVGYWRAMHFIGRRIGAQRGIHDVQQNLNLLKLLDLEPAAAHSPTFAINENDRANAAGLLREAGVVDDVKPIVIHAGSAQTVLASAKRWPPASYARLVRQLQMEFGDRVLLVEGPDEQGVAQEILNAREGDALCAAAPKVLRLTGSLGTAAAVMSRAEFYVGSDSGLAHLAAAVGTPAVTLVAPADPDRVCPFGFRDLVVQPPTECTPCMQYPWNTPYPKILCREPMCIAKISVDAVMEKVKVARAPRPSETNPRPRVEATKENS